MMSKYLKPTWEIDCTRKIVRETSQKLVKGQNDVSEQAKQLFYFVRDKIQYNMYVPFYFVVQGQEEAVPASILLEWREAQCAQKAVLLAALARAVGIPARLRFADIRNHLLPQKALNVLGTDLLTYHGYNELYINEQWIKVTPAFDLTMCRRNRISPVEFDGRHHATFHSHNQDGKLHIEYILDHGCYDHLPLQEILNAWQHIYGPAYVAQVGVQPKSKLPLKWAR